jgi:hypothetical protein
VEASAEDLHRAAMTAEMAEVLMVVMGVMFMILGWMYYEIMSSEL